MIFLRRKYTKNLIFEYLNVNSARNKIEALEFLIKDKFDVFLESGSKLIQLSQKKIRVIGLLSKIEVNMDVVSCFVLIRTFHVGR